MRSGIKLQGSFPPKKSVSQQLQLLPITPTSLPLIDKKVFDGRPENILRDGVWIQVEPRASQSRAVHDAEVEQRKIDKVMQEKEAKLKQFQRDVQQRVTRITRAQRQIVTKTQSENLKEEQEILYRSVAAAENLTPKKNRCSYNVNQVTIDASGKLTANYKHESQVEQGPSALLRQSCEIERLHRKARQNLSKKSLVGSSEVNDGVDSNLPGGFWGTSTTRDKSAARMMLPDKDCDQENGLAEDEENPRTITATSAPHDIAIAAVQEGIVSSPIIKSKLKKYTEAIVCDLPTALTLEESMDTVRKEDEENEDPLLEYCTVPPASSLAPSLVHFRVGAEGEWKRQEVVACENQTPKKVAVTRLGNNLLRETDVVIKQHRCHSADHKQRSEFPIAAPGVIEHERRKMDERSRLLSRRVFSDMEREKVREERRRRNHKCKVERLRAEKEAERQQLESQLDNKVHAQAAKEKRLTIAKEIREKQKIKRQQEKIDRQKRAERFASALKAQIQEKLEINQITLPPLCCCSASFWGTNPYTCANNCLFYRNMEAYTAALQSVLTTVERGATSCRHEKTQDHSVISLLLTDD